MRTTSKRILSLLLGILLILSMTAFAEDEAKEPITLSIAIAPTLYSYGDGIHTEENALLKRIKDEFNIELDFRECADEKYNLMLASGELPDLLMLRDYTEGNVQSLVENGSLLPLDDLLAEYGQNIMTNIPDALVVAKLFKGGSIYYIPVNVCIPSDATQRNGWMGIQARWDIYKAIGSPEIVTEDDYLNVLKQMQDYERERTGDDGVYALSFFSDWGNWVYRYIYPLMNGANTSRNFEIDMENNVLINNFSEPESTFWNGVRFFNKAYQLGILDPDCLTQKSEQYEEKVQTGKVLTRMSCGADTLDKEICGNDALMVYLPGTAFEYVPGVYDFPYPAGFGVDNSLAITINCKYPERAMEMLNWLNSEEGALCLLNGVQGEDWEYVNGVPKFTDAVLEACKGGSVDEYLKDRSGRAFQYTTLYCGSVVTAGGYPVDLTKTAEFMEATLSEAEIAFAKEFDPEFTYPGQVYAKWIAEGTVKDYTLMPYNTIQELAVPSDNFNTVMNEVNNYFLANVAKLVMAETEDEFVAERDKIILEMKDIGIDEIYEDFNNAFIEATKLYESMK